MNPAPPNPPAPDPEARLTALLLGELSPAEAAEVQVELARRPEWLDLFTRLARTLPLVREAVREPGMPDAAPAPGAAPSALAPEAPRLAPERRAALLAAFKTVASSPDFAAAARPLRRRTHWLALAAVLAALLVVGGGLLLPSLTRAKAKAQRISQLDRDRQAELERRLAEIEGRPGTPPPAAGGRLSEAADEGTRRARERGESLGRSRGRSVAPAPAGPVASTSRVAVPAPTSAAGSAAEPPAQLDASKLNLLLRYGNRPGSVQPGAETAESTGPAGRPAVPAPAQPLVASAGERTNQPGTADWRMMLRYGVGLPPETLRKLREPDAAGGEQGQTAAPVLGDQPHLGPALRGGSEAPGPGPRDTRAAKARKEAAPAPQTPPPAERDFFFNALPAAREAAPSSLGGLAGAPALEKDAAGTGVAPEGEQLEQKAAPEPAAPIQPGQVGAPGTTGPPKPVYPPEVATAENPFSTFSLNVSDVSFRLAAASLEAGRLPDPNSVRVEEFINAFDYRDPAPAPGAPLAFHWERARHPFAHNRELVRFSVRTAAQGREPGRALNLVLVLDRSGSMERADRVATGREMLRVLAARLTAADRLSVVTFARTARLFAEGLAGDQAGPVLEDAAAVTPEGGTNLEDALRLGFATAARHFLPGGVNRVILITDGAANLGDVMPESLQQLVEENRRRGLALDCFGVGWEDYNDELLEVLARHGDGRYGFLNAPEEAATGFAARLAGALQVAAADVKVQVEFNPARVTRWRLIGYARHLLTAEQFRDNTVDAAELGAAETGNALYALEVNPQGHGPLGVFRVRYRVPATDRYQEQEWPLAAPGAAPEAAAASPAMRLALTAALFGEWLAQSPYAGEVSPDTLLPLLEGVPETFADPRPLQLKQMLEQARALAGR